MPGAVRKTTLDLGDMQSIASAVAITDAQQRNLSTTFIPRVLEQTQRNIQTRVLTPMLSVLRIYPGRQLGMKMRWKSEKQRRYVLMKLRKEGNLPYRRTLALAKGWQSKAVIDARAGTLRIVTENTAKSEEGKPYQRFVTGDIGLGTSQRSMSAYAKPMQPFHQDRGWQPAAPIIQTYYKKAEDEARLRFKITLIEVVTA